MRNLKKKRRVQVIVVAFVFLGLATGLIGYAMRDGINLYRAPTQVFAQTPPEDEVFLLGGLVKEGSMSALEGVHFGFVITDGAQEIPVRYVGNSPRPDLFSEGQGTVATGRYVNGTFLATRLLAKHDENYMPREVLDSLEEQGVYKAPDGG